MKYKSLPFISTTSSHKRHHSHLSFFSNVIWNANARLFLSQLSKFVYELWPICRYKREALCLQRLESELYAAINYGGLINWGECKHGREWILSSSSKLRSVGCFSTDVSALRNDPNFKGTYSRKLGGKNLPCITSQKTEEFKYRCESITSHFPVNNRGLHNCRIIND